MTSAGVFCEWFTEHCYCSTYASAVAGDLRTNSANKKRGGVVIANETVILFIKFSNEIIEKIFLHFLLLYFYYKTIR